MFSISSCFFSVFFFLCLFQFIVFVYFEFETKINWIKTDEQNYFLFSICHSLRFVLIFSVYSLECNFSHNMILKMQKKTMRRNAIEIQHKLIGKHVQLIELFMFYIKKSRRLSTLWLTLSFFRFRTSFQDWKLVWTLSHITSMTHARTISISTNFNRLHRGPAHTVVSCKHELLLFMFMCPHDWLARTHVTYLRFSAVTKSTNKPTVPCLIQEHFYLNVAKHFRSHPMYFRTINSISKWSFAYAAFALHRSINSSLCRP